MAKYQGKRAAGGARQAGHRQQRRGHGPLIALAVILAAVLLGTAGFFWLRPAEQPADSQPQGEPAQPAEDAGAEAPAAPEQPQEREPGLAFPYALEEDRLEITALFASDILNPDGGSEMVERLASLELTNTSEEYLTWAEIAVTLTDGTVYTFEIYDLPAGGQMMAFSPENALYDGETGCESITASVQFTQDSQMMTDQVSCSVEGTTITLTNLTQEEIAPLTVVCHDSLDLAAFGGISYAYRTEAIPAGGSVTVEAVDCMVGQPAVVRIAPEN